MNTSPETQTSHEQRPFVIWLFKEGHRRHDNQSDGLVTALNKRARNKVHTVVFQESFFLALLKFKTLLPWRVEGFPKPDLIIGAGHKTHLWMLFARLFYGGKVVVLTKPSFPTGLFDLVCVPSHEKVAKKANIIQTKGVLNTSCFSKDSILNRGLIFIGASSKYYYWDHEPVFKQIKYLIEANPDILWELSTSMDTPKEMVASLSGLSFANLQWTPYEERDENWISGRLKIASRVWLTQDKLSMIYEGLTAGSEVGLIRLKEKNQESLVAQSIHQLIQDSLVLTPCKLDVNHLKSISHFNEAKYCADEVFARFS